jgi:hypothetical protein
MVPAPAEADLLPFEAVEENTWHAGGSLQRRGVHDEAGLQVSWSMPAANTILRRATASLLTAAKPTREFQISDCVFKHIFVLNPIISYDWRPLSASP